MLKLKRIEASTDREGSTLLSIKFREETVKKINGDQVKFTTDLEKSVDVTLKGGPLEVAQALAAATDLILEIAKA